MAHAASKTMKSEHGSTKGAHGKFHKGGAMKSGGHHGLIGTGKHKGGGSLIATPSNMGKIGSK
jgi:hypothetical protein